MLVESNLDYHFAIELAVEDLTNPYNADECLTDVVGDEKGYSVCVDDKVSRKV